MATALEKCMRWLENLSTGRRKSKTRRRSTNVRLGFEGLENRSLMAGITFDPALLQVSIEAEKNSAAEVTITQYDNGTKNNPYDDYVKVDYKTFGAGQNMKVDLWKPGPNGTYERNLDSIKFEGSSKGDTFTNNSSVSSFADGAGGDDLLKG